MLFYKTLTILALAAFTVSPTLSAPIREIQEQAFSHRGLAEEKRGFSFKGIGKILKSLAYNAVVGLASFSAGDAIYNSVTAPKPSSGTPPTGPGAGPTPNTGPSTPPNTGPGTPPPNTGPGPGTPNTGYTTYGLSTPNSGPPNTGYTTYGPGTSNSGPPNTGYTYGPGTPTTGYASDAPGSISQRAREERALDRGLPVDVFTGATSNNGQNRRTSSHQNLLSRADLEKAIGLFSRMLDELD